MNNQIEEGLFWILIFLTLKIIAQMAILVMMYVWAVVVWVADLLYINLKPSK